MKRPYYSKKWGKGVWVAIYSKGVSILSFLQLFRAVKKEGLFCVCEQCWKRKDEVLKEQVLVKSSVTKKTLLLVFLPLLLFLGFQKADKKEREYFGNWLYTKGLFFCALCCWITTTCAFPWCLKFIVSFHPCSYSVVWRCIFNRREYCTHSPGAAGTVF